jgi:hypothetical protein
MRIVNRQQRRAAKFSRRQASDRETVGPLDRRAELLRLVAALVDADRSVSGVTLITPDGDVTHLDAKAMRRGGQA